MKPEEIIKGKLKKVFDKGDLEELIEYCRNNDVPMRPVLQQFREAFNVSVEETNRVRTRLFRRRDYREGRLQKYVQNRHKTNDFSSKTFKKNPNGTRKWSEKEYLTFLELQDKDFSEVDIAKKLKTNLRMVKYLRLKRRLAIQFLEKQGKKVSRERLLEFMDHGDRTLANMIEEN